MGNRSTDALTQAIRVEHDLQGWDSISDHRTGTDGDHATAAWLAGKLGEAGLEAKLDEFVFQRRVPQRSLVTDGRQIAEGVPLFDGWHTSGAGITGRAELLGNVDQPPKAPIGITTFSPTADHAGSRLLERARRAGSHDGLVAIGAGEVVKPGLALRNADSFASPYGPPVLQVSTEHRSWLEAAAKSGSTLKLIVEVDTQSATASNVHAALEGTRPDLDPVAIMTPRSAWWTCTSERGGGITTWLACARYFAANRPERPVVLIASTGHELGHLGLTRYLTGHPELVIGAHAWVHLGANFAARDSRLRVQASDESLQRLGLDTLATAGESEVAVTPLGTAPGGEARNIFDGGGRFVSLLGSNGLFHHPDDRWPHAVDVARTERLTGAVLKIVEELVKPA